MILESTDAEPVVIDEARTVGEDRAGSAQAEEIVRLAGVTFSIDNSEEISPVNFEQWDGVGVPAVAASEEIYEGCTGRI